MSEVTDTIEDLREGYDDFRAEAMLDGCRLFFLKRAHDKGSLISVREITTGWIVEFDKFRGQLLASIATNESSFPDDAAQTSYFGYGVPNSDGEIDVYKIEPDRRDVVAPTLANPFWKIFGSRDASERFIVPA